MLVWMGYKFDLQDNDRARKMYFVIKDLICIKTHFKTEEAQLRNGSFSFTSRDYIIATLHPRKPFPLWPGNIGIQCSNKLGEESLEPLRLWMKP